MDFHVHYLGNSTNQVTAHYYTSAFLGKASAGNLYGHIQNFCSTAHLKKVLQISSDGQNMNLKFLSTIHEKLGEDELHELIYLETFGLHILHNSMKHGELTRTLNLKGLISKVFHENPSRRADQSRGISENYFGQQ